MNTLGERIKFLRGDTTQAAFAASLGIPQMTLSNYETGKSEPKFGLIDTICTIFSVNADWLLFGRGPMGMDETKNEKHTEIKGYSTTLTSPPDGFVMIPMAKAILSAGCGSLETDGEKEREYAFRRDFIARKGNPQDMVLMRVFGDSMEPEICHGDVVLLDQSKKRIFPGYLFAVGFEDAIYLKRIDMLPGKVILKSINPAYPPVELDLRGQMNDLFRVIGRVLWSGREYK
jgi:hypothetical protein